MHNKTGADVRCERERKGEGRNGRKINIQGKSGCEKRGEEKEGGREKSKGKEDMRF
jgi:hypothetical protein